MAAQRRIAGRLTRPARLGGAVCALVLILIAGLGGTGRLNARQAVAAGAVLLAVLLASARELWLARRRLARTLAAERRRLAAVGAAEEHRLAVRQQEHAAGYQAWSRQVSSCERRAGWQAISLSAQIDRIDVAGGTLAGWSALSTMIAAPLLSTGAEVTVLDLTEGSAAADLIGYVTRCGSRPLVWVLPGDLPRLDLGTGLDPAALADVLALAVAAGTEDDRPGDPVADCALLERVLGVLGPDPKIAQVTAALRVLSEVGDPRDDLRSGLLTDGQLSQLGVLFGRGAAQHVVVERAFALEARLRRLDQLGTAPAQVPPSDLRVVALDRRSGAIGNRMLATYLVAALTQLLRQAQPGEPWARTLLVLGADRVRSGVLDLLSGACEASRTGLVLAFRSIPAEVRQRLGRGNAALAIMRLGNGEDARAASELIGTEYRFVISQLTDTLGSSVTDTWSDSYTSTVGTSDSVADSVSVAASSGTSAGRGGSRSGFGPFGGFTLSRSRDASQSRSDTTSVSLTEGVSSGTSWGLSLSRAIGENSSLGRTAQRSREFLVEAGELQRLPTSAVLVSYPAPAGREVVLADANPALITLPGTSFGGQEDQGAGRLPDSRPVPPPALAADPVARPNLGPPPRRLDWRRPR